jgi:hypothetical protein
MSPREQEPLPTRTEAQILNALGYGHCIDFPFQRADGSAILGPDGRTPVTGGTFLDAYADPDNRQRTEDEMEGYLDMEPGDPYRATAEAHIARYLAAFFGEPNPTQG